MVQLNINFTHACLMHAQLQKLAYAHTVACNFGTGNCMRASKHTKHTRDVCCELALDLQHYTCSAATGTVAVGNEMQLFCSRLASLYYALMSTS